jgi:hypothetical protein
MAAKSCTKAHARTYYRILRVLGKLTVNCVVGSYLRDLSCNFHLTESLMCLSQSNQIPLIFFRYVKPKHFSTSAFLSEVTTPEGVRYLQPGYPPLEREDFIASFLLSSTFRDIRRVVDCADSTQEQIWVQVSYMIASSLYFSS